MRRLILFLFLLLVGCRTSPLSAPPIDSAKDSSSTLMVFAAASLTDAFTELGADFESTHPAVKVTFNFAGSHALQTQIEAGAPADVFASANEDEINMLVKGGFIEPDLPRVFATNMMVVILPKNNPAHVSALEQLTQPGIKVVIAAEEVPAGKYARITLHNLNSDYGAGFDQKVLANVVSNEDNVRQVLSKIQLGEADAGFVYQSDTVSAPDLSYIVIPAQYGGIAEYPIAVLKNSANVSLGQEFVDEVFSEEGQAILQKWGFGEP